ncbi:hypothetical protein N5F23_21100 [Pseudomonas sichuanensis]|uniref:hypothetical protein n=1 Tax=Pseudomonas sichuanensis TaxID=2213015 RepID=UPI00244D22E6|nr:hypothetical protein [Pseudomonas sichuanensis]MDH0733213.1 hypothetical protein [Pseudomonas sichuanensis]MDH1585087.1 hypothetical protein [Pseudomonas sichuanensis]MDH1594514.1 hypothetical protein [Pseudomonas sichuanensis]MDH1600234.1 hypothetical protein [Pseudomonas sichuanensis]
MASIDEGLDEARIIERALLRIKAIGLAKGVDEVTYCYGLATGYIAAALDCGIMSNDQWERLLSLAEETQESHPRSNGSSGRFD